MLTIRKEQFEALSAAMVKRFEDQMVAHIAERFPEHFGKIKEAGTRELVRAGLEKGAPLAIESVRDVATLIELMVEFGKDFELMPGRVWVRETLHNQKRSAQARMDLVYLKLKGEPRQT